ncbi:MAG: alpha/beta fold hydrolase [Clostridia bacterium]|nr:alpha/beta fold hydrolase [Clostridia bacterium]
MKNLKKALALFLCLLTLFSCFTAAVAAEEEKESYDHLPQVYVGGLGCGSIYYKDDPEKNSLFYPIDFSRVLGNLINSGDYIKQSLKKEDPQLLYDCVYSWLWDSFGMLALEGDGFTMSDEVAVDELTLKYNGNGEYAFDYDSRLDPVYVAGMLDEYIGWVLEDSGKEKIELVGSSYGTTVVMAYLNEYENCEEYIDSVVLCVPSVGGINFFGEIFSGELNIDPKALYNFLEDKLGMDVTGAYLEMLDKCGLLEVIIECFAIPALRASIYDALMQIIKDVIATLPAAWTCVQEDRFVSSLVNIFGEDYASPDHEYAGLIKQVIYYHNTVMVPRYDILKEAEESSIKMNIICKYGNAPVPASEDGNFAGDGIVELPVSSFGATTGMHNEKLPEGYTQALFPEYNMISTDGCVDASTGALPFNTWYIKGLAHGGKNEDYFKLINAVAYEDLDVFSSESHPQFLEVSKTDKERLVPMYKMFHFRETFIFEDFFRVIIRFLLKPITLIKNALMK